MFPPAVGRHVRSARLAPPESEQQQAAWRQTAEYPVHAWRQQRLAWGDFLADYYLTYDSLYFYHGWTPDFEILQRLHERGQLGKFSLGYYSVLGDDAASREAWNKDTLGRIQEAYNKARALGLLDHAYMRVLESLVEQVAAANPSAQQAAWLEQARQALQVPEEVTKSLTEYTADPAVVYRWRAQLAQVIQAFGADPRSHVLRQSTSAKTRCRRLM